MVVEHKSASCPRSYKSYKVFFACSPGSDSFSFTLADLAKAGILVAGSIRLPTHTLYTWTDSPLMDKTITSYMASLDVLRDNDDFELSLALQNNLTLQKALQEEHTNETRKSLTTLACRTIQSCLGEDAKVNPDSTLANTNW